MKTAVFCDFDGTITRRDVGYNIFHHFSGGKNDALLPDWKARRMTTRECLRREAELVKGSAEEIYRFIDQFEIDPGFVDFVELCRRNDSPVFVASDGLDFYIKYILKKHGLGEMGLKTNAGRPENGGLTVEFPHENTTCSHCGVCKGERIQQFREETGGAYRVAFVGDGYSDSCATREADLIFAKKDLERYCLEHNIAYLKYDDFHDVSRQLVEQGYLFR